MHLQNAMQVHGWRTGDIPVAEALAKQCLSLPLYPGMTAEDQEYVIEVVRSYVQKSIEKSNGKV